MFSTSSITGVSLDAAGLVALADLKTIAIRTALTGSASFLDILFLAPGIHCQQQASEVNGGEYPTTGALTTGYVFRIENQATISFLQGVGEPGHLTHVVVTPGVPAPFGLFPALCHSDIIASTLYLTGIALTVITIVLLGVIRDWWGLGVVLMLMAARLVNVVVIKRRSQIGWKGAEEPGAQGDLLVLLSQDRWIRMRGMVDDLKAVTAGQWLREMTTVESSAVSIGTLLVYGSAALAGNASTVGSLMMACLLLISVGILGLCNAATTKQRMFGRLLEVDGGHKEYKRRLQMVKELMRETKRRDWAIGMNLITASFDEDQDDRQRTFVPLLPCSWLII